MTERATDPRLEVVEETPAVVVEDAPAQEQPAEAPEPVVQEETTKPPKKSAEDVLKGRVGHLTKTLSAKDQALAERAQELESYRSRLAAAEALLQSQTGAEQPVTPVPLVANGNTTYSQADFDAAVAARAEAQEFNRKADDMYNAGAAKYPDWKDAVDTLVVSGFMTKDLLDSAMAVEDGNAVLHYLGTNLDEAERISALPPIRKAAEMAKLSTSLSTPRSVPVSSAPAPIRPVSGSPSPQLDLQRIADTDDMRSYAAARAKQGSRWANARG